MIVALLTLSPRFPRLIGITAGGISMFELAA
jgi:hypothetical protein